MRSLVPYAFTGGEPAFCVDPTVATVDDVIPAVFGDKRLLLPRGVFTIVRGAVSVSVKEGVVFVPLEGLGVGDVVRDESVGTVVTEGMPARGMLVDPWFVLDVDLPDCFRSWVAGSAVPLGGYRTSST